MKHTAVSMYNVTITALPCGTVFSFFINYRPSLYHPLISSINLSPKPGIKSKNTNMLMVITLLLCCDIIIALTYLKILPPSLCKFSWLFYFPSQYLLIKKHSP